MKAKLLILTVVLLVSAPAMAGIWPTYSPAFGGGTVGEDNLQKILDDITKSPNPGDSSVDVTTDAIQDVIDSYWEITGVNGSVATFIVEITANVASQVFGIYDPTNTAEKAVVFSGADSAGTKKIITIEAGGVVNVNFAPTGVVLASNNFGFYLGGGVGPFYSDSSLNAGGSDQMLAYQGPGGDYVQVPGAAFPGEWTPNEFVLAWEDTLFASGDGDYNDLVLMIESVQPVPVPGAVLLGMLGMSFAGMKLRRRA